MLGWPESNRNITGARKTKSEKPCLRPQQTLGAIRLGASVGHVVALAVEADDEHRATVTIADGLAGGEHRRFSTLGGGVADALAETAVAKLVGAAKEFYGIVSAKGSEARLHGAEVLVAKG